MFTRRVFFRDICIAAAAGATSVRSLHGAPAVSAGGRATRGAAELKFDSEVPVVQTSSGPIRGYIRNGVHTFKGVPYGAPTSGSNRFLAPKKPEPWKDVFNAVAYGYACLQKHGDDWRNPLSHFVLNFENGMMSEDCLNLNVWTQSLDEARRPVLIWIHGGGYQNGSSFEMLPYDGENLTRRGDIVFVSVNHRLNTLGFLDLSSVGGDSFRNSGNAGMLDLVAALEWVRDNIEKFGGDPDNVTICGQSGGGGKVNALMRMPAARGLFRRAIVQSGSLRSYRNPADSRRVGEALVRKVGIEGRDLAKLQQLPYDQLMASASEVIDELRKESGDGPMMGKFGWSPTADGEAITANDAPDFSAKIPLLVGYTRNELAARPFDPSLDTLTAAEAKARIDRMYPGGKGSALMSEYQKQYPDGTPQFIYSVVASMMFVGGALDQMEDRAAPNGATPAYAYRFDWCPDIYDGRLGAFHSLEIGFAFDNTNRWDSATGGGERAQALASIMSQAWVNFARSGNPNHRELTGWPAYDTAEKSIMIFDDVCRVAKGPDENAHRILHPK